MSFIDSSDVIVCVLGKLDLGVFVKDIIPGGAADRSGQIHPGDRIIAINGQSLEGIPHQRAVEILRDSANKVRVTRGGVREGGGALE